MDERVVGMTQQVQGMYQNGRGPWRILKGCPAVNSHNSLRAALGQSSGRVRRSGNPRCICPHALDLFKSDNEKRAERKRNVRPVTSRCAIDAADLALMPQRAPDFFGGLCTSRSGMRRADAGQNDQGTARGIAQRQLAKDLCELCPLKSACREWVTEEESPAGSWGGVWGGLDPWNRKGLELIITDGRAAVIPYAG